MCDTAQTNPNRLPKVKTLDKATSEFAIAISTYSRGHIKVPSRAELEKLICECYEVLKEEYDRLLPRQFAV
jgi:hypothetical protein